MGAHPQGPPRWRRFGGRGCSECRATDTGRITDGKDRRFLGRAGSQHEGTLDASPDPVLSEGRVQSLSCRAHWSKIEQQRNDDPGIAPLIGR